MIAIEFEADVIDGMIKIPDKYQHIDKKHLKIIALMEQDDSSVFKEQGSINTVDSNTFFDQLESRHFIIDASCDIDEVMQGMNN
jgi:hypothetical protein